MNELVFLQKEEAVTTSLIVAEKFHKRHDIVLRDIRNLDCSNEFRLRNFVESSYKNEQNKEQPMFYLTKDAFMFLVMGYRGKQAADIKEKYIAAFNAMEALLREKSTTIWIETRKQGKLTRKSETEVIKELVEYVKCQGSTHADMLYMTYSKLANALAGTKNRDLATISQLHNLSLFENIILTMIRDGMAEGLGYKEIYQVCKDRCVKAKEMAMIEG